MSQEEAIVPVETGIQEQSESEETEEEIDSFQSIFQDIVEAQAALGSLKKPELVSKHLLETTYPILGRILGLFADVRDTVKEIAEDVSSQDTGGIGEDDSEFLLGFLDQVLAFVTKYGAAAKHQASQGSPDLYNELTGLYLGSVSSKKIIQSLIDNEPIDIEESKDE